MSDSLLQDIINEIEDYLGIPKSEYTMPAVNRVRKTRRDPQTKCDKIDFHIDLEELAKNCENL